MKNYSVKQYQVMSALHSFGSGMIASSYVLFLSQKGLNEFEINMVNFFFFSTLLIFEIPTGAFADIFGRKNSYVISHVIQVIGSIMYAFADSFWTCVIAEIILAIGVTFASGAFQAWLVDRVKNENVNLIEVFGRSVVYTKIAGLFAALIGSQLMYQDSMFPWFAMAGVFAIHSVFGFLWLKDDGFVRMNLSFKSGILSMKETIRHSIEYGIKNPAIKFILFIGIIQWISIQAPNMQWQLHFIQYFIDQRFAGFFWIGISLSLIFGSIFAKKLSLKIKEEKTALLICQNSIGIFLIGAVVLPFPINILFFMLHEFARGVYDPIKSKFMHDNIPDKARATISSFESVSPHLGAMIGLPASGYIAKSFGIPTAWIFSGLFLVTLSVIIYIKSFKKKMT